MDLGVSRAKLHKFSEQQPLQSRGSGDNDQTGGSGSSANTNPGLLRVFFLLLLLIFFFFFFFYFFILEIKTLNWIGYMYVTEIWRLHGKCCKMVCFDAFFEHTTCLLIAR